jgi:hypothetical protein
MSSAITVRASRALAELVRIAATISKLIQCFTVDLPLQPKKKK